MKSQCEGDTEGLMKLMDQFASEEKEEKAKTAKKVKQKPNIGTVEELCDACMYGDMENVSKMANKEKINEFSFGRTPLYAACFWNQVNVVKYLLSEFPNELDVNKSPLYAASYERNCDVVKALLVHPKIAIENSKSLICIPDKISKEIQDIFEEHRGDQVKDAFRGQCDFVQNSKVQVNLEGKEETVRKEMSIPNFEKTKEEDGSKNSNETSNGLLEEIMAIASNGDEKSEQGKRKPKQKDEILLCRMEEVHSSYVSCEEVLEEKVPEEEKKELFLALYSYERQDEDELTFDKGEEIELLEKREEEWWFGKTEKGSGMFPVNFVEKIE